MITLVLIEDDKSISV